jgi:methionyl-tRNA formyltransferase
MRVVIAGSRWFGAETLRLALRMGLDVAAALVPGAEGEDYDRLYAAAQQCGIYVKTHGRRIEADDIPDDVDVIVAAHCHVFITAEARQKVRHGCLGYHPSLLPRHRGRDAIRWVIHMREPVTGGTVYWMDDGADTGPIAAQDWCHVRPDDDAATLWRRDLAPMGLRLLKRVLEDLQAGIAHAEDQDEALATWEPAFGTRRLQGANHVS